MERLALEAGEVIDHPKGSLRWNAQRLLMNGETTAINMLADRLDGKVPQAIVGDEEHAPIQVLATDEERLRELERLLGRVNSNGHDKAAE